VPGRHSIYALLLALGLFLVQNTQPDADRFDALANSLFNLIRPIANTLIAANDLFELINFHFYGRQHRFSASFQRKGWKPFPRCDLQFDAPRFFVGNTER